MKIPKLLFATFAIAVGLFAQAQAQTFLTNGLVAYYPFNGNANDASGNGNNGYMIGGPVSTTNRFGQPNTALCFNGTNSFVAISNKFLNIGADYTLTMWFCTFDASRQFQELVGTLPNPTIDISYNLPLNGADLHLEMSIGNGTDWIQPTQQYGAKQNYLANQWYQVVAIKSGSSYSTFVDGVVDASFSRSPGSLLIELLLGLQWYGIMDDVRVYNRALSTAEVQQLYTIESGLRVDLIKAVKPSFSGLAISTNYQLQVSTDLNTWTNQGSVFTATNSSVVYPQYFDVDNWNQLFFRVQVAP